MVIVLALVLAALLFGLGFAIHLLWIAAAIVLVFWLAGFAFRQGEGHWYRW